MAAKLKLVKRNRGESAHPKHANVKFEVYGEEMLEKEVKSSGNSGRVYLPPSWIGHQVKIIKVN